MRGSSAGSLTTLTEQLLTSIDNGADATRLGDDLFTVVATMRQSPALRRAATDPTAVFSARSQMLEMLFEKHLSAEGMELVSAAGGLRWGTSHDIVETFERLGVIAIAKAADQRGEGDRLEGELFSFAQTIAENPPLREALTDGTRSAEDKQRLLRTLLEGKATEGTIRLAEQAISGNNQTVRKAFDDYARIATESRGRLVAVVRAADPLSDEQKGRLADELSAHYGKPVHLNVVINPDTLGGLQVEIGDEVIDGTISSRLQDARRRLAG